MDGEMLDIEDCAFDAAFSIFGVTTFADWRAGLREQFRVVKTDGRGGIASWREPPGGGTLQVLIDALREVFPNRSPPDWPEGTVTLSDLRRLEAAMTKVGWTDIEFTAITPVWEGPPERPTSTRRRNDTPVRRPTPR